MPAPCPACAGTGCGQCAGSGVETLDLLRISDARMREIRGNRIAMIFQDPGKALNPGLTIRDQVAEVFFQHRTAEILEAAGIAASGIDPGALLPGREAAQRTTSRERAFLAPRPDERRV